MKSAGIHSKIIRVKVSTRDDAELGKSRKHISGLEFVTESGSSYQLAKTWNRPSYDLQKPGYYLAYVSGEVAYSTRYRTKFVTDICFHWKKM